MLNKTKFVWFSDAKKIISTYYESYRNCNLSDIIKIWLFLTILSSLTLLKYYIVISCILNVIFTIDIIYY